MLKSSWGARRSGARRKAGDEEIAERRIEWAEQLAQTALQAGLESRRQARDRDELAHRLLDLIEAHRDAASRAGVIRTGDKRLYKHAFRARAELESATPVAEADELSIGDGPAVETENGDPRLPAEGGDGDWAAIAPPEPVGTGSNGGGSANGHSRGKRKQRWH